MKTAMGKLIIAPGLLLMGMGMAPDALAASDYYEFSTFGGPGSEYDVGSYGNTIYYGGGTSVYAVDVSIADMTKKNEPRFLADGVTPNPNYQTRTFTNNRAITLTGAPGSLLGASTGEMWIDANNIYTIGSNKSIYAFDKTSGAYVASASSMFSGGIAGTGWGYSTLLSYGGGQWWMAGEYSAVYSSADGSNWNYEFTWPSMGGGHGDGMEYVNGYLFVSDMTSNFIGQWAKSGGVWSEINRFSYTELGGNKDVEGMGFGALDHFWAGSGNVIYELGGGKIQEYTDGSVPEPGILLLFGAGLMGMARVRRNKAM